MGTLCFIYTASGAFRHVNPITWVTKILSGKCQCRYWNGSQKVAKRRRKRECDIIVRRENGYIHTHEKQHRTLVRNQYNIPTARVCDTIMKIKFLQTPCHPNPDSLGFAEISFEAYCVWWVRQGWRRLLNPVFETILKVSSLKHSACTMSTVPSSPRYSNRDNCIFIVLQ